MNLSPAYLQWREATLQQGLEQGALNAQRLMVENLLKAKFGILDEALSRIIEPLLELPPEESTLLLIQLSREELLARFNIN